MHMQCKCIKSNKTEDIFHPSVFIYLMSCLVGNNIDPSLFILTANLKSTTKRWMQISSFL